MTHSRLLSNDVRKLKVIHRERTPDSRSFETMSGVSILRMGAIFFCHFEKMLFVLLHVLYPTLLMM